MHRFYPIIVVLVFMFSSSFVAMAHQGATGIVKDRMDRFAQTKTDIRNALRHADNGAFDDVIETSRRIAEWGRIMPDFFPEGSTQPPTESAPAIWDDFAGFTAAGLAMSTAADRVIAAAETADIDATVTAIQSLGQTCGACHRHYRK